LTIYAVAVLAVSGATCFYQLDRGMLFLDEAYFAYTTEHMLRTGDYIVPSIGESGPHLYAAPLYNWLCCLTADVLGDGALRYRAWCAAFGVGCALAALLLGAVVAGPEVGFLAGLLVATNHYFLFMCGAREGRMDPPLAVFVTVALVAYIKAQRSIGRGMGWWALVGTCLGGALLMKPPPFGCFFFTLLTCHHLLTRHSLSLRTRIHGPALAASVMGCLAIPWYIAIYTQLGWHGLDEHIISTSIGRVKKPFGRHEPWWFYLNSIWESSLAFKLAGMAAFWGLLSSLDRAWKESGVGFSRPGDGVVYRTHLNSSKSLHVVRIPDLPNDRGSDRGVSAGQRESCATPRDLSRKGMPLDHGTGGNRRCRRTSGSRHRGCPPLLELPSDRIPAVARSASNPERTVDRGCPPRAARVPTARRTTLHGD